MTAEYDIVETATRAGNFRVFVQVLEVAGLKRDLEATGLYTIFAPTDNAFLKMPQAKLETLWKPVTKESLQSLVKNHIVFGKLLSSELMNLDEVRTAIGEMLKIESRAGLWLNEAQVVLPDLKAFNGVLHGIDTVLMPQNRVATTTQRSMVRCE